MKGLELLVSHKDEKKYVLIIGCGRLGASLANEIYSQGNDVCILDQDREAFRNWIPLMEGLRKLRTPRIWRRSPVSAPKRRTVLFW